MNISSQNQLVFFRGMGLTNFEINVFVNKKGKSVNMHGFISCQTDKYKAI